MLTTSWAREPGLGLGPWAGKMGESVMVFYSTLKQEKKNLIRLETAVSLKIGSATEHAFKEINTRHNLVLSVADIHHLPV